MGGGPCAPLGSFSTVGAWPRAHPGSPVTAGHTPNPLWAPVLGESPPVPREEAELGGCHQVGLPGPGLDRGFLCGGNRDRLSCREHATGGTFRRRTRGGKEPGPRASRSGKSWDSSWGRQVTNRRQAGQQTEQGRSTGAQEGTAGGASPPHAQRGGPGFQGALRQREETRHRNRGVRAWWSFSEGLLGDATGTVIPGLALLDNWSWAGPGEPAQLNRPFPGS